MKRVNKDFWKEMNAVIENIRQRRSIRKYKNKRVPKRLIKDIIEAGRYAPSAHNSQPWRFIVIEDKKKIKELSEYVKKWFKRRVSLGFFVGLFNKGIKEELEAAKKRLVKEDLFFYNAPLLIIICAKPRRFTKEDCACAAQNMMLVARSLGIGSCWIGFADIAINKNRKLMRSLGVPEGYKIMGHLIFGYPIKFPEKAMERKKEANVIR